MLVSIIFIKQAITVVSNTYFTLKSIIFFISENVFHSVYKMSYMYGHTDNIKNDSLWSYLLLALHFAILGY